jgi:hypothetical protein
MINTQSYFQRLQCPQLFSASEDGGSDESMSRQEYIDWLIKSIKFSNPNFTYIPSFGLSQINPRGGYSIYDPVAKHYVYTDSPYVAITHAKTPAERLAITVKHFRWDQNPNYIGLSHEQMYQLNMTPHFDGISAISLTWERDPIGFNLIYPLEEHKDQFFRGYSERYLWNATVFISAGLYDISKNLVQQTNTVTAGRTGKLSGSLDGLTQSERRMVNDLLKQGNNVEIIPKNPNAKTFDFRINGVPTELKTIQNPNVNTGITRIQDGFAQGNPPSVIVDARGTGLTQSQAQEMINRAAGTFWNKELPGTVQVWTDSGIIIGGK